MPVVRRAVSPTGNNPAVSSNGQTIAYDSGGQIFTIPIGGGTAFQVTTTGGSEPAWSPDGATIYYTSGPTPPDTTSEIMKVGASGAPAAAPLTSNAFIDQDPAVSPDGTTVAFASNGRRQLRDLRDGHERRLPDAGLGRRRPTPNTDPTWSPDGTRIAFVLHRRRRDRHLRDDADLDRRRLSAHHPVRQRDPAGVVAGRPAIAVSVAGGIATFPVAGTSTSTSQASSQARPAAPRPTGRSSRRSTRSPGDHAHGPADHGRDAHRRRKATWATNPATTYAYLWLRCDGIGQNCVPIVTATSTTYVVQPIDAGPDRDAQGAGDGHQHHRARRIAYSSPAGHLPDWPVNLTAPACSAASRRRSRTAP